MRCLENVREYIGRLLDVTTDLDNIAREIQDDQVRERLEIVRDSQHSMLRDARRILDEQMAAWVNGSHKESKP